MTYLASQNIVHCDLALRNLLVTMSNEESEKYLIKVYLNFLFYFKEFFFILISYF